MLLLVVPQRSHAHTCPGGEFPDAHRASASTSGGHLLEGLGKESKALAGVYPAPAAVVERMRAAVEAGAQTREGELDLEASLDRVPQ
ncbi:hypothetical protein ABT010_00105 [Streptomyces sp. NPDC002668]|uniref:hypothetical protein n=1 Tax=Streptomyces sp. NPDC002668 TaxID=3154422 RepID=UPI003332D196